MDRRTWMQLVAVLAAAREGQTQQGGAQQQPPRVTKDQVVGALKLLGLEFQDAEIDMAMRGVNQALSGYEALRKVDVPIDTEPAFCFRPGLADRKPIQGPQRFETSISRRVPTKPKALEDLALLARGGAGAADSLTRGLVDRPDQNVSRANEAVFAEAALPDYPHRRSRARSEEHTC